jgi:hypothetical protein
MKMWPFKTSFVFIKTKLHQDRQSYFYCDNSNLSIYFDFQIVSNLLFVSINNHNMIDANSPFKLLWVPTTAYDSDKPHHIKILSTIWKSK